MNVEELQLHLTNLASLLRSAKAAKTANELDDFCSNLQPFRDLSLKNLVALLTDKPAAKPTTRKPKKDPAALRSAMDRIADLYERAAQESVTREHILAALQDLETQNPTAKELKELAPRLNSPPKGDKETIFSRIRAAVLDRKGLAERVQV